MDYYYSLNNQPAGPVPLEQLHELYRAGVITLATLVVPVGGSEWKPYSSVQPSRQDLAGSAVPGDVPPANGGGAATAPPQPTQMPPFAAAPPASSPPGYGNLVLISWALLGVTALLSVIPVVGCITWVMLIPVFITTVILGVLTLQRGGTTQGILILIASVVVLPLFTLIAPIVTTALFGAMAAPAESDNSSPRPLVADASPAPSAAATASKATREAGSAKGHAGVTTDTPTPVAAKQMVNATMTSFKNAVNSGNFDAFYRTELSNLWKQEVTVDKLRTSFKPFVDKKLDLTPIFAVEPVLDEPPYVDANGLLTLVGHYPVESENVKVAFELVYSREGKWALSGIKVNLQPLDE